MSLPHKTEVYPIDDMTNVDPYRVVESGIKILTLDLDKTVLGQFDTVPGQDRVIYFEDCGRAGLDLAVVSNAYGERINRVRLIAAAIGEIVGRECFSVVPDDVGGLKKPYPDMFNLALDKAGINTPLWAMHVGDQVRSDVVGAERAGYRAAVVVKPMGRGDDEIVKWVGRPFVEPILRHQRGLPVLTADFPGSLPDDAYRHCR